MQPLSKFQVAAAKERRPKAAAAGIVDREASDYEKIAADLALIPPDGWVTYDDRLAGPPDKATSTDQLRELHDRLFNQSE